MALRQHVSADLKLYTGGRSSLGNFLRCLLFSPGFMAIFSYRLCCWARTLWLCRKVPGFRLIPGCFIRFGQFATGCEINPRARIDPGVKIHHPSGIVIGKCTIEAGAQLFQCVTLGADGTSPRGADRYPSVGPGATIFAGAKIIGPVRVGARALVGANSVVLDSVPDGGVAVGIPARVIKVVAEDDASEPV